MTLLRPWLGSTPSRLQAILTGAAAIIQSRRLERLKARPPDSDKLRNLRNNLEHVMGGVEGQLPTFGGFTVGHAANPAQRTDRWQVGGIDKGELVTPPLSPERTDLFETIVGWFIEHRGNLVWQSFCQRRRQRVRIASSRYPIGFWKKVVKLAADFGTDAVLLVPFDPIGSDISTWTYRHGDDLPAGLHVEFRQNQPTGGGTGYVATVEGSKFYTAQLPADRVWLFSARTLGSILYARLPSGNLVDLVFDEADDPRQSTFVVSFAQMLEWHDLPIIEFVL